MLRPIGCSGPLLLLSQLPQVLERNAEPDALCNSFQVLVLAKNCIYRECHALCTAPVNV